MLDPDPALEQGRICTWRSVMWIRICMDSQWFWSAESVTESKRAKVTHKSRKKRRKFRFWSAGCSLSRAKGFTCSLNVLHRGLGIKNCKIRKKNRIFSSRKIWYFSSSKPWIRISIETSADPQHCLEASGSGPVFRIRKILGDRDPLVVGMDPDPSRSSKNSKKRKPLISIVLWLLDGFISVKNYVNVPSKNSKQKNFEKK